MGSKRRRSESRLAATGTVDSKFRSKPLFPTAPSLSLSTIRSAEGLDMKYLMFDLEATRRERDDFRAQVEDEEEEG